MGILIAVPLNSLSGRLLISISLAFFPLWFYLLFCLKLCFSGLGDTASSPGLEGVALPGSTLCVEY